MIVEYKLISQSGQHENIAPTLAGLPLRITFPLRSLNLSSAIGNLRNAQPSDGTMDPDPDVPLKGVTEFVVLPG